MSAILARGFLAGVLMAGASASAAEPPVDTANSYDLKVNFDPATGALNVQGALVFVADRPTEQARFLLNNAVKVETFGSDRIADLDIAPKLEIDGFSLPKTQGLNARFSPALKAGEAATITVRYAGNLTTDSIELGRGVVSPRWTELSFDTLWYPVVLEEPIIRSRVVLTVPPHYDVIGPGQVSKLGEGRWLLDPGVPTNGRITFALSDSWTVERKALGAGREAALYSVRPEPRAEEILSSAKAAFSYFQAIFGPPPADRTNMRLLYANADIGLVYPNQAYSTGGDFIVLDNSPPQVQLDTLNHEVAHFWFYKGQPGTPDEFLSESVAEYLAMLAGGEMFGAEWLERRRAKAVERSAAIKASLLKIDGISPTRQPLLYERGPVVLWQLHDRVGQDAVLALLRDVRAKDIQSLATFLDMIAERHGAEVRAAFEGAL